MSCKSLTILDLLSPLQSSNPPSLQPVISLPISAKTAASDVTVVPRDTITPLLYLERTFSLIFSQKEDRQCLLRTTTATLWSCGPPTPSSSPASCQCPPSRAGLDHGKAESPKRAGYLTPERGEEPMA